MFVDHLDNTDNFVVHVKDWHAQNVIDGITRLTLNLQINAKQTDLPTPQWDFVEVKVVFNNTYASFRCGGVALLSVPCNQSVA